MSMGAHVYAPLDASALDDSVTDRGTGSPKKSHPSSTKNEEIDPAHLTGVLAARQTIIDNTPGLPPGCPRRRRKTLTSTRRQT
jgi:hypothetical protein